MKYAIWGTVSLLALALGCRDDETSTTDNGGADDTATDADGGADGDGDGDADADADADGDADTEADAGEADAEPDGGDVDVAPDGGDADVEADGGDADADDVAGDDALEDGSAEGDAAADEAPACTPAWGLINELLPNEPGSDAAGTLSFIEIRAAADTDLSGAVVELVNGRDGSVYDSVVLTGRAGADGLFVLSEASVPNTDQVDAALDIQNGPDNVILRDTCGTVLDAVGYGVFGGGDFFVGEGAPVPVGAEGQTLSRCSGDPAVSDTGDNSADFSATAGSPGEANPSCT